MATYDYTRDIPATDDNPSDDQPDMKVNTNSIDSLIGEDHYSFGQQTPNNDSANGFHKQVRLPNLPSIPSGTINQSTTIYSKSVISSGGITSGQNFITNGVSGNEYQMTITDNTNFSTFGNSTNYPTMVTNQFGGWTFLPGNLRFQYGTMLTTGVNTVVKFPVAFTNDVYSLVVSLGSNDREYGFSAHSNSGFTFSCSGNPVGLRFYWQAIGN